MRFLICLLLLSWMTSAAADVEPRSIEVVPNGEHRYQVDVVVHNPSGNTARGPIVVKLFIRGAGQKIWRPLQTWKSDRDLYPKRWLDFEFDSIIAGREHKAFEEGRFEVRVDSTSSAKKTTSKTVLYP